MKAVGIFGATLTSGRARSRCLAIRTASVDWNEHPSELISHLDRLAGANWRRDPNRWAIAASPDLDKLIAGPFPSRRVSTRANAGVAGTVRRIRYRFGEAYQDDDTAAPPRATVDVAFGKPRLALPGARAIAASAERAVATGGDPLDLARACLVVARCRWSMGAPPKAVGDWLRKSVDHVGERAKHLDEDLVGAARLVGRAPELAKSNWAWPEAPDGAAPERAFTKVLVAYAKGAPPPPHDASLSKRHFYAEFSRAIRAARQHDTAELPKALARAPWAHRREWTAGDDRKRLPDWSFMLTALAADKGDFDALPPTSRPFASADLVEWSRAGTL